MSSNAIVVKQDEMVELYAKVTVFLENSDVRIDKINHLVKTLEDADMKEGLQGGQGDICLTALASLKQVVKALQDQLANIRKLLDYKIQQASDISKGDSGFRDINDQIKKKANEMRNLKK